MVDQKSANKLKALLEKFTEDYERGGGFRSDAALPDVPKSFVWKITSACNMSCSHCSMESRIKAKGEFNTADALCLIDELAELGLSRICISGGEPLLRRDFWKLLSRINERGMKVKLNTNGWFLDAACAKKIARLGVGTVQISIISPVAGKHDAAKGKKRSFERALRAIDFCKDEGITVLLSTIAMKGNLSDIKALARLADEHGAYLYVKRFHPTGSGRDAPHLAPSPDDYKKMAAFLNDYYGGELMATYAKYQSGMRGRCIAGSSLCVNSDGSVQLCAEMPIIVGNVRNGARSKGTAAGKGIADVWRDIKSNDIICAMARKERLQGKCATCSIVGVCGGGCRADAYGLSGNIWAEDPYCWRGPKDTGCPERNPLMNTIGMLFGWI